MHETDQKNVLQFEDMIDSCVDCVLMFLLVQDMVSLQMSAPMFLAGIDRVAKKLTRARYEAVGTGTLGHYATLTLHLSLMPRLTVQYAGVGACNGLYEASQMGEGYFYTWRKQDDEKWSIVYSRAFGAWNIYWDGTQLAYYAYSAYYRFREGLETRDYFKFCLGEGMLDDTKFSYVRGTKICTPPKEGYISNKAFGADRFTGLPNRVIRSAPRLHFAADYPIVETDAVPIVRLEGEMGFWSSVDGS